MSIAKHQIARVSSPLGRRQPSFVPETCSSGGKVAELIDTNGRNNVIELLDVREFKGAFVKRDSHLEVFSSQLTVTYIEAWKNKNVSRS